MEPACCSRGQWTRRVHASGPIAGIRVAKVPWCVIIRPSPAHLCHTSHTDFHLKSTDGVLQNASMASNAQHIRFRRPDASAKTAAPKPVRHTGILQDQLRRCELLSSVLVRCLMLGGQGAKETMERELLTGHSDSDAGSYGRCYVL